MPYPTWPPPPTHPLPCLLLSIAYTLLLLAYPPPRLPCRFLAYALFCLPAGYAFVYHQYLTPWWGVNDTLGRMVYIWGVYVSWVVLVLGVRPVGGPGWRERGRWAGKMLFARDVGRYWPVHVQGGERCGGEGSGGTHTETDQRRLRMGYGDKRTVARRKSHGLNEHQFATHHVLMALGCFAMDWAGDAFLSTPSHSPSASHLTSPLKQRIAMTWDTCISDALYFNTVYSLFALLWVCILRLDEPSEWSLSLFGSLADCWSVRRYWGVYWHDYIGASFSAHAKLLTRGLLGWERPSVGRRAVENTLVFVASGLAHSLVRYVATEGRGEVWTVAVWYAAQMLPILVEGGVQHLWGRSRVRRRAREWVGGDVLWGVERAVGYMWVLAWMFWSVPKYLLTRNAREMEAWRRRHPQLFGGGGAVGGQT